MALSGIVKAGWSLFFWSILPVIITGAASVFGVLGSLTKSSAPSWLIWAVEDAAPPWLFFSLISAVLLVVLLIAKAIRDHRFGQSLRQARYDAVRELHNRLGPALDLMTELALINPDAKSGKLALLRTIAKDCCSALVAMTPESIDVRAAVFQLTETAVDPIGHFGRSDAPRTFRLDSDQGREIETYLTTNTPQPELYPDTLKRAPAYYEGAPTRYQTFIRVPIFANGIIFGMVTVDAPKRKSLDKRDIRVAEFVAAQLGPAFAIAAA